MEKRKSWRCALTIRFLRGAAYVIILCAIFALLRILTFGPFHCKTLWFTMDCSRINEPLVILIIGILICYWSSNPEKKAMVIRAALKIFTARNTAIIIFIGSLLFLVSIKLYQHYSFNTGAYDLSMYDTAISNTLRGKFLFSHQLQRNFLSEHFAPFILIFIPFYWIFDIPIVLLILLAFAGASAIVSVFFLAKYSRVSTSISAFCAMFVFGNSYFSRCLMFDFHHEIFVIAIFLIMICAYQKENYYLMFIMGVLSLTVKEDMFLYVFFFGVYLTLVKRKWRIGTSLMILSVTAGSLVLGFILPALSDGAPNVADVRLAHLGNNIRGIIWTFLSTPALTTEIRWKTLWSLTKSFLFLPILSPYSFLVAIPGIILNSMSSHSVQKQLIQYYSAPVLPFVIWPFIKSMARIEIQLLNSLKINYKRLIVIGLFIFCFSIFSSRYKFYAIQNIHQAKREAINLIPEGATISAQNNFIPHLRRDQTPWVFPKSLQNGIRYEECEYILLCLSDRPWPLTQEQFHDEWARIRDAGDKFTLIYQKNEVLLYKVFEGYP